jgi:hypothetical protein
LGRGKLDEQKTTFASLEIGPGSINHALHIKVDPAEKAWTLDGHDAID